MQSCYIPFILFILFWFNVPIQVSANNSTTYVAAVVEFHPTFNGDTSDDQLSDRIDQYVAFIQAASKQLADIIVFPESTLTTVEQAQFVPDPDEDVNPCDSYAANGVLARISCAVRRANLYAVINLTMKRRCDARINGVPCTSEWSLYNTNVVLNRNGHVISMCVLLAMTV